MAKQMGMNGGFYPSTFSNAILQSANKNTLTETRLLQANSESK